MPARLRKNAKKRIDRPFAAAILRQAREVVTGYQVILRFEDGEYYGRGLEMPLAMGSGRTPDECVTSTREAMLVGVATLIEDGESPPLAATSGRRTEQINIRLTPEERTLIEESARAKGFRGISDYVRALAVSDAR